MRQVHDNLWIFDQPLRFFGVEIGTRMSVVRFGDDLLLHSPIAPTPELRREMDALGQVKWVVGPNKFHHLYLKPWMDLGAHAWASPGLAQKRKDLQFEGLLDAHLPWPDELEVKVLESLPFVNEAVFFHQPSKTLIVTDLLFNIPKTAPLLTRLALGLGGAYPGPSASNLERLAMKRDVARNEIRTLLDHAPETIVLAHGQIIADDATAKLHKAYGWLGDF
ncbi:DUF4336 domain-containing protein [Microvenator marinus]|jgi:hypothetical protein|uniref:DUF4336 domain-containing protein n=1 Tax=Microvenator marinus TaxID=2600177 RepID=A0A5B8XPV1_9DELT|nr:DUF4336 domain-containing protein [Microvenator marinus]QED25786.1 DUF4336 domain-containing protein [Microvenator marinus]